jgi:LmbE family N-acetylglucosaminyl deacetylase
MARKLALVFLLVATSGFSRNHAVLPPPSFAFNSAQNILWIGAHPDDEVLASPFLGIACREFGARCTFLVMTRGEAGTCGLPEGCFPDLGTVRAAEMRAASEALGAQLIQWTLPNTNVPTPFAAETAWSEVRGGRDVLLGDIRAVVASIKPTTIVTFDPAHGSTCHPEHRAVGSLVLDATHDTNARVLLVETRAQFEAGGFSFSSAAPRPSLRLDGARKLSTEGRLPWDYLLLDVQQHRSQFTPEQVQLLRETPREQRYVDFAEPAAASLVSPCP